MCGSAPSWRTVKGHPPLEGKNLQRTVAFQIFTLCGSSCTIATHRSDPSCTVGLHDDDDTQKKSVQQPYKRECRGHNPAKKSLLELVRLALLARLVLAHG